MKGRGRRAAQSYIYKAWPIIHRTLLLLFVRQVWRVTLCLLRDRGFCLLLWCFGGGLALFNALLTVLSQLLRPCGYSEEQSGTLGAVFLGSGTCINLLLTLYRDGHIYLP